MNDTKTTATITVELPNGKTERYESDCFTLLALQPDKAGVRNLSYTNCNIFKILQLVMAYDDARKSLMDSTAENITKRGGGAELRAIKITGTAKEVSFTLQHMAAWFGGKTAVASIPPKSLKAFQSKFYRKEVATNGNTRY